MEISSKVTLPLPELALIGMTRVFLGIGLGLLGAESLDNRTSRGIGIALTAVGVLTTLPLALRVREQLVRS